MRLYGFLPQFLFIQVWTPQTFSLSQVSYLSEIKCPLGKDTLNCTLIGENCRDKMSLGTRRKWNWKSSEALKVHLLFETILSFFPFHEGGCFLTCTSAELCIFELIVLICNSLQAFNSMLDAIHIYENISLWLTFSWLCTSPCSLV